MQMVFPLDSVSNNDSTQKHTHTKKKKQEQLFVQKTTHVYVYV